MSSDPNSNKKYQDYMFVGKNFEDRRKNYLDISGIKNFPDRKIF